MSRSTRLTEAGKDDGSEGSWILSVFSKGDMRCAALKQSNVNHQ